MQARAQGPRPPFSTEIEAQGHSEAPHTFWKVWEPISVGGDRGGLFTEAEKTNRTEITENVSLFGFQ